ncbi:MAG: hypothetical protein IKR09_08595, partial [Alphaproteobacteria bacterium]|nr:hypothetical protein [Alphaproteobacteria bacterium]
MKWLENDLFVSVLQTYFFNEEMRVDIYNQGKSKKNTIKLLSYDFLYEEPDWCKSENGNCFVLRQKLSFKWKLFPIKFKVIGDGEVMISFAGPYKENKEHGRHRIFVDYKDFNLNNKNIFRERHSVWHDKPYNYVMNAKDGDIIEFDVKYKRRFFRIKELNKRYKIDYTIIIFYFAFMSFLSFLVLRKLSMLRFVSENGKIDTLFMLAFCFLLVFPASHISTDLFSGWENRKFSKYDPLFNNIIFNKKYSKNFEKWFEDRFNGRNMFININIFLNRINRFIKNSSLVFDQKTHWIWSRELIFSGTDEERRKSVLEALKKLNEFLRDHNIKFYFMIVPSKTDVYND